MKDKQPNESVPVDCVNIIVNNGDVWDEIDKKDMDSYQLEWQWGAPCLWLSGYPAATIRLCDTEEASRFKTIVSDADPNNSILSEKYFRNKDYAFSINNKEYIWHPKSGQVSFNDRKMSVTEFENMLKPANDRDAEG